MTLLIVAVFILVAGFLLGRKSIPHVFSADANLFPAYFSINSSSERTFRPAFLRMAAVTPMPFASKKRSILHIRVKISTSCTVDSNFHQL